MSGGTDGEGQDNQMEGTEVGKVLHVYGKISVAAISAEAPIKVGDKIRIYDKDGNVVVEQEVESMEIDREKVEEVKKGDDFGMVVDGEVKEGYLVYKVE